MAKCKSHRWQQKANNKWYCPDCTVTMPCKTNCAHFDCAEFRKPSCIRCTRTVKEDDIFLIMIQGVSQPIHNKCIEGKDLE